MENEEKIIAKEYYRNGQMKFLYSEYGGNLTNVDLEINVTEWFENGKQAKHTNWFLGNETGEEWYENGQIKRKYEDLSEPITHGAVKQWSISGQLMLDETYKEWEYGMESRIKSWYENGQIEQDVHLINGGEYGKKWCKSGLLKMDVDY